MKLLLVEDSIRLRKSLKSGLSKLGYAIDTVDNGLDALKYIVALDYDVVILDVLLPELDGLSVLKEMRSKGIKTHVLILSARDQLQDRIKGLDLGADDYLVKPFSFDELHARICALLRRAYNEKCPVIRIAQLKYNTKLKQLDCGGQKVNLTPCELSIFEQLLLNRGRVMSHEKLELCMYDSENIVNRNTIEAHVSGLRKKLRKHTLDCIVKTQRGFGYFIEK
jgi:DNA-binding response OmpR family regulator